MRWLLVLVVATCVSWADTEGYKEIQKCTDGQYTCFESKAGIGALYCLREATT